MTDAAQHAVGARTGTFRSTGPFGRRYLGFVGGMGLSAMGDAAWAIALAWTLVSAAGATVAGTVLAIATLPKLITLLGGGALADSRGPREVMMATDLGRFGLMAVTAAVIAVTGPVVPVILAAAVLLSLMSAFFTPASGALRPLLLDSDDLVRGNSMYLIGLRGGQTAGGPLGAFLLGIGGFVLVAVANAITFLVATVAVWQAKPIARDEPEQPAQQATEPLPPMRTRIAEGFRYVIADPRLRLVVLIIGLTELAGTGPANLGLVLLSSAVGSGAAGAGLLLASFTVGASACLLCTTAWPPKRRPVLAVAGGTAAQATALASLGLANSLLAACAGYFALGFVSGFAGVILVSLLQRWSQRQIRGRVMSIMALVLFSTVPVGNLAFGVLVDLAGTTATMLLHAAFAATATAVYLASPALRSERLD